MEGVDIFETVGPSNAAEDDADFGKLEKRRIVQGNAGLSMQAKIRASLTLIFLLFLLSATRRRGAVMARTVSYVPWQAYHPRDQCR